jgi:adenylate cyclase
MTASKLPSNRLTRGGLWVPSIVAALLAGLVLGGFGFDRYSRSLLDLWQRSAPRSLAKTDVRVVWIDDASIKSYGAWPWPRYIMARLTEVLVDGEPDVIAYDMLFADPDRNAPETFASLYPELPATTAATIRALPSMDKLFGEVLGSSQVVLGRAGLDTRPAASPPQLAVEAQFSKPLPLTVKSWGSALANIPLLDDVALGHGFLNASFDRDGVARRVPLVGKIGALDTPSFALEIARVARRAEVIDPIISAGALTALRLDGIMLPVGHNGSARLRFGKLPENALMSAADLLSGNVSPKILAGKIVIVGLNAAGTADLVTTPIEGKSFGTIVQANAVDSILKDALLARPHWGAFLEGGLAVLMIGLTLLIAPRLRGYQAGLLAIGSIVGTLALSAIAFYEYRVLIDATGPLTVSLAAATTSVLVLFAHARRTLMVERLVSARASGELSAARQIQIGMLPERGGLEEFDDCVDLDALIEPARSIGGDFYDVIRLDEHRVCFLIGDVTGKGVPAALFMALSKALAKSVLLRESDDLGAAVTRLNDEIARDNSEDMFVTMLFGVLDTRSGRLDLCNAGHENPYRIDTQGAVTLVPLDGGPPLCVAPNFLYDAETIMLSVGESIIIVSDGITEAQSPDGDFFGHERLAAVLTDWQASSEVSGASNALLREVRAFEDGAEATDDLTVLVFRYTGAVFI